MRRSRKRPANAPHKDLQLARQIERAVSETLAADFDDLVLQSLHVDEVMPAPDASRMLVVLSAIENDELPFDLEDTLERLEGIQRHLREEVAAAIHRKKVPELVFKIRPPHDDLFPDDVVESSPFDAAPED